MSFRACLVWVLAVALSVTSAAPARAGDKDVPLWTTPGFWKASAGAATGAWAGAKLLGWGPMLSGLSQIAKASPFAALVVRPVVPVLAGALGAQIAGKGLAHADWAMVATQTVGGALGTAAALLVVPGAGAMGPWIGEAIGWYLGRFALDRWRAHVARRDAKSPAPSATVVPSIHGASDAATVAYERFRSAQEHGETVAARAAYSGVVSTLAH